MTLTAQQVFDKSVEGMFKQGGPSKGQNAVGCEYRNPYGRKCAAGLVFTDKEIDQIIEHNLNGRSVLAVFADMQTINDKYQDHYNLLMRLQEVHDSSPYTMGRTDAELLWNDIPLMFEKLKNIATSCKLNDTILKKTFGKIKKKRA